MKEKNSIKFETLHKQIDIKTILLIISLFVIVILVIVLKITHAAYTSSLNVPFVRGKINYKHPDLKVMAMHVQDSAGSSTYNETNIMPNGSEYVINKSKSYCTQGVQGAKDTGVVLETVNGRHVIEKLTKNDRCYLYFDELNNVASILAKYTKDNSRSGEITANFTENTPTTIYSKEDDYGTSYVFAGVNPNNWVKIGNIYFRIIRFNGNGSMRLIYSGTSSPATSGTGTQIGIIKFNDNYNDNAYVGLQYTVGEVHGTGTNSAILGESASADTTTLYGWYNSTIKNTYGSLIDTSVGFCSDRESFTNSTGTTSGGGTGTKTTYYGTFVRYLKGGTWQTSYTPTLKCKNSPDLLKLPVGLITADEYMLAGGGSYAGRDYYNTVFWLHTSQNYWTMSPYSFANAEVFRANSFGFLSSDGVTSTNPNGVRPVINLKSATTFENNGADGSSAKPWTVKI